MIVHPSRTASPAPRRRTLLAGALVLPLGLGLAACGSSTATRAEDADASEPALPQGVAADQPYIQFGDGGTGDTIIDVYLDFLCPYCKKFSEANGADLAELSTREDTTVRLHLRPMLDRATSPTGYSGRSANAALAVYDEEPTHYWAMESALYDAQPAEDSAGLDDARLIELAHGAGATAAVDQHITGGTFIPYVEKVVEPEARAKDYGTPVVEIDGTEVTEADLYVAGGLLQAVQAAR